MMNKPDKRPPHEEAEPAQSSRSIYESLIERRMAAAEAAGLFDNLPGAGKPLQLDDDSLVPQELRLAFRMLKNADYAPSWIELQKLIRQEHEALERWLNRANARWPDADTLERARLRSEHNKRIRAINRLIDSYNLSVPPAVGQLPLLVLSGEARRLGIAEL